MAEIPAKLRKQRRQLEIQVAHEPGVVREIGFQGLPRITPPHVAGFFPAQCGRGRTRASAVQLRGSRRRTGPPVARTAHRIRRSADRRGQPSTCASY